MKTTDPKVQIRSIHGQWWTGRTWGEDRRRAKTLRPLDAPVALPHPAKPRGEIVLSREGSDGFRLAWGEKGSHLIDAYATEVQS